MAETISRTEMFFIDGERGKLLAVLNLPEHRQNPAETVIVVPPFSEEMNRVRRVVALQARSFAKSGFATLSVDLFGTGDSDGEFEDASWETWKTDIIAAIDWVRDHHGGRITLLGIRLGAMLALDIAGCVAEPIDRVILWQPSTDGGKYMRDFMFIRVMAGMMQKSLPRMTIEQIRAQLSHGKVVEISGYNLTPAIYDAINGMKLELLEFPADLSVHWIEIYQGEETELKEVSRQIADRWQAAGKRLSTVAVKGHGFWVDGGAHDIQAWIDATTACLEP